MTIREWKEEMMNLIGDFQFETDIEALEELVNKAKEIKATKQATNNGEL